MAVARDQALNAYFRRPRLLRPLTEGHVNDSWLVATGDHRFVVQRINGGVFKDPTVAARNFVNASRLVRSRDVRTLTVRKTRSGEPWFVDGAGGIWRAYAYVEGRVPPTRSPQAMHDVAFAFGAFDRALDAIDATQFAPAIARFHDFGHRMRQFDRVVAADRGGRVVACEADIALLRRLVAQVRSLDEFAMWSRQPPRLVHNDAKPANLLRHSPKLPCVIDLDTVGPGRLGYDLGELVRSAIADDDDDSPLDPVTVERTWSGFLSGWRQPLARAEQVVVPIAGIVLALELASRYLADHLDGDWYFAADPGASTRQRAQRQMRRAARQLDALDDLRERAENLLSSRS
ncbi:MAG: aminoglycoside phosphotransferase family protein [Acidimicrobiales bacterium]